MFTHFSTNQTQCRPTAVIETNVLQLSQTTSHYFKILYTIIKNVLLSDMAVLISSKPLYTTQTQDIYSIIRAAQVND